MEAGSVSNVNYNNYDNSVEKKRQNENVNKNLQARESVPAEVQDSYVSSAETAEEKTPAFTMTTAQDYEDGSDVKELAYTLAKERDREDVDLSQYTVLRAGDSDNAIQLSRDSKGNLVVDVDGEQVSFTAAEARKLIIDGGDGADRIIADDNVKTDLHIVGGKGNDTIETAKGQDFIIDNYGANNISAGDGDDHIIANQLDGASEARTVETKDERNIFQRFFDGLFGRGGSNTVTIDGNNIDGGAGDDYIEGGMGSDAINGGKGNDVIYGLDGNDSITGGDGRDYIDGGKGDDTISAGEGNDMVFGGRGADTLSGDDGDDVIVGGRGKDTISAGDGSDNVTTDGNDVISGAENTETVKPMSIPDNISIDTNDEGYRARVQSDLDALAATSTGQQMLNGLADMDGHKVKIASTDGGNYCSYYTNGVLKDDGTANVGSDSTVAYNRSRIKIGTAAWGERPPIVGMYHEMAHSYDVGKGVLDSRMYNYDGSLAAGTAEDPGEVKGAELQAVGIDTGAADLTLNPEGISENSLRDFLGLDTRPKY